MRISNVVILLLLVVVVIGRELNHFAAFIIAGVCSETYVVSWKVTTPTSISSGPIRCPGLLTNIDNPILIRSQITTLIDDSVQQLQSYRVDLSATSIYFFAGDDFRVLPPKVRISTMRLIRNSLLRGPFFFQSEFARILAG